MFDQADLSTRSKGDTIQTGFIHSRAHDCSERIKMGFKYRVDLQYTEVETIIRVYNRFILFPFVFFIEARIDA